ncbi:MAG: D-2-hydroxyacid dehydrogenase [Saprospiraceae bacterium]|nr:D-2-hydroxyacid dehydrogenase [Saprospiraceae bacterium]MCF8252824.1 D-2-hydroxyacid dehydrogenase [Saprospiraceae bacterium]MCF8283270.1 D-2-hydroxyacid dehydrogenase [Bacteroidales bacterium]MCF8314379.1 D-2-hydroxyacid dehydrogenase [Saprospiraceae bacterium]MCF8443252.1 D-2-hydroxyacid dehydrogenase [Saprospiraceae bacterium]
MIKILANDGIHPDGQLLLEEAGYQVVTEKVPQDKLAEVLPGYDVIIVRSATKVRKDLIDACPNLKLIARGGVGLDNVDHEYARSKGIHVVNTPKASSRAVAELVFTHAFSLARLVNQSNREMLGGDFNKLKKICSEGIQLRGRTMGIIGFGRIGHRVAQMAIGIGMDVLSTDLVVGSSNIELSVFNNQEVRLKLNLNTATWDEVLRKSDFITLHVPGGKDALIGAAEFAKMKDGVIIINTARGGTIDEDALLAALASGKVRGAGLDVFVGEPNPRKEILEHPRISVSPHVGGSTQEAQTAIGLELADQIIALLGN